MSCVSRCKVSDPQANPERRKKPRQNCRGIRSVESDNYLDLLGTRSGTPRVYVPVVGALERPRRMHMDSLDRMTAAACGLIVVAVEVVAVLIVGGAL